MFAKKSKATDPRKTNLHVEGGRRSGESQNPYLSARRTWNEHTRSLVASQQMWQIFGILALLVCLVGIGGIIQIGSQSKFVPYVIEVDKLGQPLAIARADKAGKVDQRVVKAMLADWISNARTVTPDAQLQRKYVFDVYAMLSSGDSATQKMNEWLNGNEEANPFNRAKTEMVSIDIGSVLPQTADTWQIDWVETTRDRQGVVKGVPANMRALVNVYLVDPKPTTTEEQMHKNPLGVYVRDFSWSQLAK